MHDLIGCWLTLNPVQTVVFERHIVVPKHIPEYSKLDQLTVARKQVILIAELILKFQTGTSNHHVHPHDLLSYVVVAFLELVNKLDWAVQVPS